MVVLVTEFAAMLNWLLVLLKNLWKKIYDIL